MARPFLENTEWPGRRIKSTPRPSPDSKTSEERASDRVRTGVQIIPETDHSDVRDAFVETHTALKDLETQTKEELNKLLNIPTTTLPQTAEAVLWLTGNHPEFGNGRPDIPESHKIHNGNIVDLQVMERAINVMKHADRIVLGFDTTDIMSGALDGKVRPYGSISSPAQAAGEPNAPTARADTAIEMEEVVEQRLQVRKRDIWFMMFKAIIAFIVRAIADFFKSVGDWVSKALSIKILGKRIKIGKFIARPFYWLEKKLRRLADRLERVAMGLQPDVPDPVEEQNPEIEDIIDLEGDTFELDEEEGEFSPDFDPETDDDFKVPSLDTDRFEGSSGLVFLMSAQQVLGTVDSVASRSGNEDLWQALRTYDTVLNAGSLLTTYQSIAGSWGVDLTDTPLSTSEINTGITPQTSSPTTAQTPFDCD